MGFRHLNHCAPPPPQGAHRTAGLGKQAFYDDPPSLSGGRRPMEISQTLRPFNAHLGTQVLDSSDYLASPG